METINIPVIEGHFAGKGPASAFEQLLEQASHPNNILLEVMPDNEMKRTIGLQMNDGVVIDRGYHQPHSGGDYYLIQFDDVRVIRQVMLMMDGNYHVGSDYGRHIVKQSDIQVIGRVLGSVKVRNIY